MTESKEIKDFATSLGADMVGIAGAEALENLQPRRKMDSALGGARAIVIFGYRMLDGGLQSPDIVLQAANLRDMYAEIMSTGLKIGRFIEKAGHLAASIPPHLPIEMTKETAGLLGPLSLRHAAVAAGLGSLGLNRLLINETLGTRTRLGGVITTADLEPDEPNNQELCDNCMACVEACPVSAIDEQGSVDVVRCLRNVHPYGLSHMIGFLRDQVDRTPEERKKAYADPFFWNLYQAASIELYYACFQCQTACPIGLSPERG